MKLHERLKKLLEFTEAHDHSITSMGTKYIQLTSNKQFAYFDYEHARPGSHCIRIKKDFEEKDLVQLRTQIFNFNNNNKLYSDIPIEETYDYIVQQSIDCQSNRLTLAGVLNKIESEAPIVKPFEIYPTPKKLIAGISEISKICNK